MKLYKFHIFNLPLRPVNHGNAVASSNLRIGGSSVYLSAAPAGHQSYARNDFLCFPCIEVQHIHPITGNVVGRLSNQKSQVMLSNNIHHKTMMQQLNVL